MSRGKQTKTLTVPTPEDKINVRNSVAFSIDLDDSGPGEIPARLTERLNLSASRRCPNAVAYTDEESVLMAEIMRESTLLDIKTKAGKVDHKIFDAGRRRMCFDSLKEQENKRKQVESSRRAPDIRERQRKVKEMADTARRRSAENRLSSNSH